MLLAGCLSLLAQSRLIKLIENEGKDLTIDGLDQPIHKVAILNEMLWVTDYGNGNVFKSTDNGETFNKVATLGSEYFESIQFLDEEIGFVSGDYGFVYKTLDGGEIWVDISPPVENRLTERFRNDSTKNQTPNGNFAAYYSMHFINASQGYVSGFTYNPKLGFGSSFKRLFFTTVDGGANWKLEDAEGQKQMIQLAIDNLGNPFTSIENEYFLPKQISWTVKKNRKADILIKQDYLKGTIDTVYLESISFEKRMLRNITFISEDIGFVFGGSIDPDNELAIIYSTSDGGKSWKFHPSNLPHVHVAGANKDYLFLFGKEGFMKCVPISNLIETLVDEE